MDFEQNLIAEDKAIYDIIQKELLRQQEQVELIASENIVSKAVMEAQGSILTNKYAEGYPAHRYYCGCEFIDEIEVLAQERAKKLFGAEYVNVQPHSGSQANMAVYVALMKPGETLMGMSLDAGGHLTHGSKVSLSGKMFKAVQYGVRASDGLIDYDAAEALALAEKPKIIVAGGSAYPRQIDFARFRSIADKVGAYLMVDMAHFAGLVAGGVHPNPLQWADVVTTTTHKTLRGPRGGMILTNNADIYKKVNSAVFPGTQGGPLEHIIAAKAVCFGEALKPEFKEYQQRVIDNAHALADALKAEGFRLVSGGTDNHLMLIDLRGEELTGKELEHRLDEVYITVNKNAVPGDTRSPFQTSGIRLGTPAVTTRGLGTDDMKTIAHLIKLTAFDFENSADYCRAEVTEICRRYPLFD